MPYATHDGVSLYYELGGSGETVAFLGDCGFGAWQWGWQAPNLAGPYETLVCDIRGIGRSEAPNSGYDIETLAGDLEAVLSDSDTPRAHLVGAGLGGMVALQYARQYNRAHTLTLFGVTADGGDIDEQSLRSLYPQNRTADTLAESLSEAFSDRFLSSQSPVVDNICAWRAEEDGPPAVVENHQQALQDYTATELYELTRPTLVCNGLFDPVVPVSAGRTLATNLPRGTFEAVEGKRLCFIEHSRAVTDRLFTFLDENEMRSLH